MIKTLLIIFAIPSLCLGQNYVGLRTEVINYNLKSQYERPYNNGLSYSGFGEFKFKKLISFGAEVGGYKFEFDNNKSTNLFIKPTVIFNIQTGRSNLAINTGFSYDVSITQNIRNPYKTYSINEKSDYSEKAYFYKSFASLLIGASYSYRITDNVNIGVKIETSGSQGGFYKGYESNFNRFGIFVKYKI